MFRYWPADVACSEKPTGFRECGMIDKTVGFEEQIMSMEKYPSILSRQVEDIEFAIFNLFRNTRSFVNLGISLGYSQFELAHIHLTSLDQLHGSENI